MPLFGGVFLRYTFCMSFRMRFTLLFLLLLSAPAMAADGNPLAAGGKSDQPIDVSADQSLEWDQNARTYTARGNAKAARGDFTIFADLLTAFDRDKPDGSKGTEVWKLEADGNVKLTNGKAEVFGDKGVYDIDRQVAVLTGENLRLISGADTVTAQERFEYWSAKRLAVAKGEATVTRPGNGAEGSRKIIADEVTTLFYEDAAGQLQAERSEAHGNVRIFTQTDTAKGDHAIYDLKRNKALLVGNVRLTREKSQLEGDRAEVDFKTGVSRLLADDKNPKRVRGLLYPQNAPKAAKKDKANAE